MNNLLFTALLIVLLYYFFYYLPSQKKLNAQPLPLQHNRATQTEETKITNHEPGAVQFPGPQIAIDTKELDNLKKDLQQKEQTIIGLNNSYNKLETKKNKELEDLKKQINTITHQLTQLQTHQTKDEKALENTLDELLKGIQDLNNELD